jgi:DNA (cytosine-5)-methyltransferase 1
MKYLSVCSGIEAATVAWHSLGWEPLAFSEIEPFPRKVLTHHYPDVRLEGDFTKLREQDWIKDADILVGGTPCQAFSVAGLRNSLDDDRGNLTLEFVRLADAIDNLRPIGNETIIVWENVPGVLSVKDNAFGCFLGALVGNDDPLVPTGGKWTNAGMVVGPKRRAAWRVLDAQYFGVAQRRRRVFVVASARDGIDPAEVLFEREGLRRHTPPSRQKGQEPSATIAARFGISRNNHEECVSMTLQSRMGNAGFDLDTETPIIVGALGARTGLSRGVQDAEVGHMIVHGTQDPCVSDIAFAQGRNNGGENVLVQPIAQYGQIAGTLSARHDSSPCADRGQNMVAQPIATSFYANEGSHGMGDNTEVSVTLKAHPKTSNLAAVSTGMAVRRLTPRECERLQGFPDDYTAIPNAADGLRYKALGNSMAVPVMAWIGKRIANG